MRARALALAAAVALSVAPVPQGRSEPFVPVGVWYGGGTARAPMVSREPAKEREAWRRDLQTIRSLGFNSIRTWVEWASAEPDRGRYRFDALDQVMALADDVGLKVIVQIYADAAPEWLGSRCPDASLVTDQGARIGAQASPGYCLDHAGVRTDMTAFVAAAAARAAAHRSFYGIDVWSDPHIVNRVRLDTPVEFCYCPHTRGRLREWLKLKYRSLDVVNAAWHRTFASWDDVEAPRLGAKPSATDFIDWKTFVAVKLRDDLKLKADAAAPRGQRPVSSHSDAPAVMLSPLSGLGNPDDWWMATAVDQYGTSIYPKHASAAPPWSPVRLASTLDGIRSAARDRGWWIGELQAGRGSTGGKAAAPVTGADLRLWGWAALSRGASAISYYAWYPVSSGESNGYGMIELDGTVTERARAAGTFADVVSRNPGLFALLRPRRSRIAILYNRLSYLAGGNTAAPGSIARDSMLGFYRALFERNIQVDFLHQDEVVIGLVSSYDAVVLTYPVMLAEGVAQLLKAYVREGGTLISEARPGWNDERGSASPRIPGFGLDEVFGARETRLQPGDAIAFVAEPGLDGALAPLAGRRFGGTAFAEHLEVTSPATQVLARFPGQGGAPGAPAMVASRFGKGRAILVGTFPAAVYEQDPAGMAANGELLQRLVAWAGIGPDVRIEGAPGRVEARFLESADAEVLIAINHGETSERVTFNFGRDVPEAIWQNMETGTAVNFIQTASGPIYRHTFPPDVMVLVIKKKMR